jgi:hypothetical protein
MFFLLLHVSVQSNHLQTIYIWFYENYYTYHQAFSFSCLAKSIIKYKLRNVSWMSKLLQYMTKSRHITATKKSPRVTLPPFSIPLAAFKWLAGVLRFKWNADEKTESASKLYWLSDDRLSVMLVPTFADRRRHRIVHFLAGVADFSSK